MADPKDPKDPKDPIGSPKAGKKCFDRSFIKERLGPFNEAVKSACDTDKDRKVCNAAGYYDNGYGYFNAFTDGYLHRAEDEPVMDCSTGHTWAQNPRYTDGVGFCAKTKTYEAIEELLRFRGDTGFKERKETPPERIYRMFDYAKKNGYADSIPGFETSYGCFSTAGASCACATLTRKELQAKDAADDPGIIASKTAPPSGNKERREAAETSYQAFLRRTHQTQ